MSVIDKALERFPDTNREDWRQVGKAAVHKHCTVGELAKLLGPAICIGGVIWGGVIRGGVIWGGEIWGGVIWGGEIRGGEIWGGVIRGGVIWGGVIRGGVIWGGVIRGGVIWGGVISGGEIRGGEIWGGVIRGGVINQTPLQIFGACEWPVVISQPGHIAVGCQCHTPEHWREHIDGIARLHRVNAVEKARVMRCVEIAAQWLIDNPDAVTETELLKEAK